MGLHMRIYCKLLSVASTKCPDTKLTRSTCGVGLLYFF